MPLNIDITVSPFSITCTKQQAFIICITDAHPCFFVSYSHIDIMDNITTLNLENAILKFHGIINHSFDLLVPMITLDLNTDHNVSWSNYNLRKIIKLKKISA